MAKKWDGHVDVVVRIENVFLGEWILEQVEENDRDEKKLIEREVRSLLDKSGLNLTILNIEKTS